MEYNLAFILWSCDAAFGFNAYVVVDKEGKIHIINGDRQLWIHRNHIKNYDITANCPIKQIENYYTVKNYYIKPRFETYLTFKTETHFDLRDILIEMYEPRVYTEFKKGTDLRTISRRELKKLITGDNSYTNRGYKPEMIDFLLREAQF